MFNKKTYPLLLTHLQELRRRVIILGSFFLISFALSYFFSNELVAFLVKPLMRTSHPPQQLIYTHLTEAFLTKLNLAFCVALIFSLPMFLWQLYIFLAPGLYQAEKKVVIPFFVSGVGLFFASGLFTYYILFPAAWEFFVSFKISTPGGLSLELLPKLSEYLSLVLHLFAVFGLVFQLPILLVFLAKIGLLASHKLIKFRRAMIVVCFIIGAICTPPDIYSQIALAIPMAILYEIAILVIKFNERKQSA